MGLQMGEVADEVLFLEMEVGMGLGMKLYYLSSVTYRPVPRSPMNTVQTHQRLGRHTPIMLHV